MFVPINVYKSFKLDKNNISILQIIMIVMKKLMNKNFFGNIYLLLSIFFNYSNYNDLDEQFKKFIDSNQNDLFDLIFHLLSENECNIH